MLNEFESCDSICVNFTEQESCIFGIGGEHTHGRSHSKDVCVGDVAHVPSTLHINQKDVIYKTCKNDETKHFEPQITY